MAAVECFKGIRRLHLDLQARQARIMFEFRNRSSSQLVYLAADNEVLCRERH